MTLFIQNSLSILFLHVPKCGGSSIAKLFKDNGYSPTLEMRGLPPQDCLVASPQHQTCANLKPIINMDKLGDIFIVARNPYARIISEFNWQLRDVAPDERPDINEWTIESLEKASTNGDYSDNHFRACVDFIDENLPCKIFKLEDGIEFVAEFFLRKNNSIDNIDIPTEKDSKSFASPHDKLQLNSLAIQAINQFYKDDFEAFGYKFITNSGDAMGSIEPHQAEESDEKEKKIKTIIQWRQETIDSLYKKVQQKIELIYTLSIPKSNAALKAELQQEVVTDDMKNSSDTLYSEILSKIDHSKLMIRELASSQQGMQAAHMATMKQLTDQYRRLLQDIKVDNISNAIQLIDQYRGMPSKMI